MLLLPYDRLKASATPFEAAHLPPGKPVAFGTAMRAGHDERIASLLAASAALFYRYSGQTDIPLSLAVDGHGTVRSAAVTIPVSGSMAAADLMAGARAALDQEQAPADPDAAVFLQMNVRARDAAARGRPHTERQRAIRADLCFEFEVRGESVAVSVTYNRSLFAERTVTQLAQHFGTMLLAMQDDPSASIGTIDLFSADEHRWLAEHRRAKPRQFEGRFIHEEIAEHAAHAPEKAAVRFNDRHLTYAELDGRANQLARY
ncbi:MAG: hypothetical protein ACREIV_13425, partial [Planctomycetaceae bacterium]